MTRPEDVALLRRVADLLPQLSYSETARELREFASRLEGERKDGVTRLDMGDGEFDEIVGRGDFHVERMSNESVWVRLHDQESTVWSVARGDLRVTWHEPPQSPTPTTPTIPSEDDL